MGPAWDNRIVGHAADPTTLGNQLAALIDPQAYSKMVGG
jgi:hypothetical protein